MLSVSERRSAALPSWYWQFVGDEQSVGAVHSMIFRTLSNLKTSRLEPAYRQHRQILVQRLAIRILVHHHVTAAVLCSCIDDTDDVLSAERSCR